MSRVFNSILCQNCEPEHITTTPMNLYAIESGSEINRKIDDLIIRDHLASEKVIKLLLLGPSGSGKSTILKQMK
uniref:Uncharacterized protein n=1 Tax=Acrobeloides nanus TaxID=290746 RepID=A0A914E318_9BILA